MSEQYEIVKRLKHLAKWSARERQDIHEEALTEAASLIQAMAEALEPFAEVADHDIGNDEADFDLFRPMSLYNARAPLLTVGTLRRARDVLALLKGSGT